MRHIKNSDKDGIFILVHPGVPNSTTTEYGETITEGSICIDYTYKDLYILKNTVWQKYGVGFDGNAYIPLDGTAFNKPVTGDIEFTNGRSIYSGDTKATFYSNSINFDNNIKRLTVGNNFIYSLKNTPLLDSNSNSNFITTLSTNDLTVTTSYNNKIFMTMDDDTDVTITNSSNNIINGSFRGSNLLLISNNYNLFNLIYTTVSLSDTVDISNNTKSDITLNISSGSDALILNNTSLYANISAYTNSQLNSVNASYIRGVMIDSNIHDSLYLNLSASIINTEIANSSYLNITGGIIANSDIQLSTHNIICSSSNVLNMNDVNYSVIMGSVSNMQLSNIEKNIIINTDGYTIEGSGLGSGSNYNTVLQSISNSTSLIKGNNNFISNIKNINKTNNIEEFEYNFILYTDSIIFDGLTTPATSNIVIAKDFNSTVGSNNLIIHNGTTNNVFGDYNFLYGKITLGAGININDGNIILGNNNINSTITSNNIILGAKNLTSINHNSQDENIILNVDNFLVDDTRTVYLPNTINMVNNGYISKFNANNTTQNNTYYLPNSSGTIALLSDIGTGTVYDAENGLSVSGNAIKLGGELTDDNTRLTVNSPNKNLFIGASVNGQDLGFISLNSTVLNINNAVDHDTVQGNTLYITPGGLNSTNQFQSGVQTVLNANPEAVVMRYGDNKLINLYIFGGGIIPAGGETLTINDITFTEGIDFVGEGNYVLDTTNILNTLNWNSIPNFVSVAQKTDSFNEPYLEVIFSEIAVVTTTISDLSISNFTNENKMLVDKDGVLLKSRNNEITLTNDITSINAKICNIVQNDEEGVIKNTLYLNAFGSFLSNRDATDSSISSSSISGGFGSNISNFNNKKIGLQISGEILSGESFTVNGITFTEGVYFWTVNDPNLDALAIANIDYSSVPNFVSVSSLNNVITFIFSTIDNTIVSNITNSYVANYLFTTSVFAGKDFALMQSNNSGLQIGDTGHFFNDNTIEKQGIRYAGDYSATYTDRSLIDKAYADSLNTNAIDKDTVKLAENINKGQAVYVSGANGTNIIVSKASNTSEATSSKTFGLLETSGVTNDIVNVVTRGLLTGLDTSAATVGDAVWLGTNGDLLYGLVNKPYAPAHLVFIGVVTRHHAVNGEIFVNVQNGFELNEIHNVSITTPTDNQALIYESSTGLWKNKDLISPTSTAVAYVLYNSANAASSDMSVSIKGDGSILLPYCSLDYALTTLGGGSTPNYAIQKSIIVLDSGQKETLPDKTYNWSKSITLNNGVCVFASNGSPTDLTPDVEPLTYLFEAQQGFSINGGGTIGVWNKGLVEVNGNSYLDNITILYNQIPIKKTNTYTFNIDKCKFNHSTNISVVNTSAPYEAYINIIGFSTVCQLTTSTTNYANMFITRCIMNNTILDVTVSSGYGGISDSILYAAKPSVFSFITFTSCQTIGYNFTSRNNTYDLFVNTNNMRTAFNVISDYGVSMNDRIVRLTNTVDMVGTADKLYCYNLATSTTNHNSVPKSSGSTFIPIAVGLTIV